MSVALQSVCHVRTVAALQNRAGAQSARLLSIALQPIKLPITQKHKIKLLASLFETIGTPHQERRLEMCLVQGVRLLHAHTLNTKIKPGVQTSKLSNEGVCEMREGGELEVHCVSGVLPFWSIL